MRLTNVPSEFQKALPILEKIRQAGFEAYFVGGSVRDALLERPIHDVDIATSSYPEETKSIFDRTIDIGIEHGTVLVLFDNQEYEITTFRTEDVYVDYRRPSQVNFVRSLDEDLKRRDFTVNAFALTEKAEIIDRFDGLRDLKEGKLRAVGSADERFGEDALRIMRGLRFTATLDFEIEKETFQAMIQNAHLLEKISVERLFVEFDKLLMAKHWKKGLAHLIKSGAYNHLPLMSDQSSAFQKMIKQMNPSTTFLSSEQAWAYLLTALEIQDIKSFLKKWKTSNDFQKKVQSIKEIYQIRQERPLNRHDLYRYGKDIVWQAELLRQDSQQITDFDRIERLEKALPIHHRQEVQINGSTIIKEFSLAPGPILGRIIEQVEWEIVEGSIENTPNAIKQFIHHYLEKER